MSYKTLYINTDEKFRERLLNELERKPQDKKYYETNNIPTEEKITLAEDENLIISFLILRPLKTLAKSVNIPPEIQLKIQENTSFPIITEYKIINSKDIKNLYENDIYMSFLDKNYKIIFLNKNYKVITYKGKKYPARFIDYHNEEKNINETILISTESLDDKIIETLKDPNATNSELCKAQKADESYFYIPDELIHEPEEKIIEYLDENLI